MKRASRAIRPGTPAKHGLSYQLREIIEARGFTAYAVGQLAEVDPGVVKRFLNGERDIRLETADRLATALGLRLVELARAKGRPKAVRPERSPVEQGEPEVVSTAPAGVIPGGCVDFEPPPEAVIIGPTDSALEDDKHDHDEDGRSRSG